MAPRKRTPKRYAEGTKTPVGESRTTLETLLRRHEGVDWGAGQQRFLGIDPGLRNLGIFVLGIEERSIKCLHRETFETPATMPLQARLHAIGFKLTQLLTFWQPHAVGYESLLGVTTGKEMAGKGNADRGPLLMVCGMLELACQLEGVRCRAYATSTARVAVLGKGKTRGADKKTTRARVQEITGTRKLTLDQSDAGSFAFAAFADRR